MDEAGTPKITDFGLSDLLWKEDQTVQDSTGPKGTPPYKAPEVTAGGSIDKSVDVYAFGVLLHELLTGRLPSSGTPTTEPCDNVPPALAGLVAECMDIEPTERPTFEAVHEELCKALCEALIPDEEPRSFWMYNFGGETSIPFRELCAIAEDSYANIEGLKGILSQDGKSITMKEFSRLYKWFGPWFTFGRARAIIQEMKELAGREWFHGFISKETAVCRLNNRDPGTFLVRLSDTTAGFPFTVSYVKAASGASKTIHSRIKRVNANPSVYEFSETKFKSLDELVSCYGESLSTPCPKEMMATLY